MPSFKTNDKIQLQPNDQIGYEFQVTSCSTSAANDGFLPFGRSVTSFAVSGYGEDAVTPANDMIQSSALSGQIMTVVLKYPAAGAGRYRLEFILTLDNGQKKEADFGRIEALDL
jgi:hypothetical protein